jgi:hypothetical protein
MTDAEIEQERQRIEPPPGPLYVDKLGDDRNKQLFRDLVSSGVIQWKAEWGDLEEVMTDEFPYTPDGTITRPFLTLDDARKVQQPGQDIIIAGYATISRVFAAPNIPESIKERTE